MISAAAFGMHTAILRFWEHDSHCGFWYIHRYTKVLGSMLLFVASSMQFAMLGFWGHDSICDFGYVVRYAGVLFTQ